MEENLRYSSEAAKINRAIFLKDFGNPMIFVEDDDKEYWYECILDRIFPGYAFEVNACGGKSKVEEAYHWFGENYSDCKCIYMCDGDFDILIERFRISSSNFIYLKKYEIENYIIDEKSLLTLLIGRIHGSKKEARKLLNFNAWYNDTINSWYELMLAYIVAQINGINDIENANINAERYMKGDSYIIDVDRINEYKEELNEKLKNIGKDLNEEITKIKEKITEKSINKDEIIKGKYLLVSAKRYIRSLIRKIKKNTPNIANEDLFNILLNTFNINSLDYIKEKVSNILIS